MEEGQGADGGSKTLTVEVAEIVLALGLMFLFFVVADVGLAV